MVGEEMETIGGVVSAAVADEEDDWLTEELED